MGQSGRRIAESGFSVGAMVDRLTECYDGLLVGAGLAPIPAHKAESCELPPASRGRN
jgi:hypothetical protein